MWLKRTQVSGQSSNREGSIPVKEPWAGIISCEPDCNVVPSCTKTDNITSDRIFIVVSVHSRTADHVESVLKPIRSF